MNRGNKLNRTEFSEDTVIVIPTERGSLERSEECYSEFTFFEPFDT